HARSRVGVIAVLAAGSEAGDGEGEQGGGRDAFDVLHVFSVEGKGPGADPGEPAPEGPRRKEHGKRRGRGGGSGSVTLLRGALVAALLREQGQLLVGGLLFLEGLEDQRQGLLVTKLVGQGGQGAVGGDLVVLD